jgi:glycosyltransferase involved in cell wall biosynthesis
MLRALLSDEAANRRSLLAARSDPSYARAWEESEPLISVTVATVGRPELLRERSLPSILRQDHERLELIVVGDDAGPETAEAVGSIDDERVAFTELGPGDAWTDDPHKQWLVGATRPRNAAVRMARGAWIVQFDDDDEMRPECLSTLLALARRERAEAVYGQIAIPRRLAWARPPSARKVAIGRFPPAQGHFSWAAGMYHSGLRFLERELVAAELDVPGDWWLAERMLRAGVRFAMHDGVLCDVYPGDRGDAG